MINNKRGLSGVVVSLITVLLAIVAIGIVWVVIAGMLDSNTENLDIASKCQGAVFSIQSATNTSDTACEVKLKRIAGTSQEVISGFEVSVDGNDTKTVTEDIAMDIIVSDVICDGEPGMASARVYFEVDGEEKYCPSIDWTA